MTDLRMPGIERGRPLTIFVDGRAVPAWEGESVAAALLAAGCRVARLSARAAEPRGYFCGTGTCQECLMTVDGLPDVPTCVTEVRDGQRVETQRGLGAWSLTP